MNGVGSRDSSRTSVTEIMVSLTPPPPPVVDVRVDIGVGV